jgi:asparagine synthetase B (glutamine-hydrolysing)
MDYLALRERCRKFLNKAIMIVRGCREAYFPYLDHEFIEALARLPVAERVTHSIQTDLTRRSYPKLLRTPYEKTMIPLSASPLRKTATKAVRALRRRAVGRIPFVTPQPPKVPNHYYTKWTRTEMRPILADLLYNENAAFRAYLQWDTVERALDEHFSGQRSWEALLGALAVIEIAHRIWIEPSSVDAPMSSAAGR